MEIMGDMETSTTRIIIITTIGPRTLCRPKDHVTITIRTIITTGIIIRIIRGGPEAIQINKITGIDEVGEEEEEGT